MVKEPTSRYLVVTFDGTYFEVMNKGFVKEADAFKTAIQTDIETAEQEGFVFVAKLTHKVETTRVVGML